jgi:hypothetical protein
MNLIFGAKTLLVVLLSPSLLLAAEYHCEDQVISAGDTSGSLLNKCGEPDWKQFQTEEVLVTVGKDTQRKSISTVEEWAYNSGPHLLLRFVEIRDGKVMDVKFRGFGFVNDPENRPPCIDQNISKGESALEVLGKCGKPAQKSRSEDAAQKPIDGNTVRKTTHTTEIWTFNSGPEKLLRVITLRDGSVSDIRSTEFGYEERSQGDPH